MIWHPSLSERLPMVAWRLGFREGELRLYLRAVAPSEDYYVIQFEGVAAFYDALPRGRVVRISDRPGPGSFGWWVASDEDCRSVRVSANGAEPGLLLVLARHVEYHIAGAEEVTNWPG
jgi:hypothetical protein